MGTKTHGDPCLNAAMPDEPMFILLGRDTQAPELVRKWATERGARIVTGAAPAGDWEKVMAALNEAAAMEYWRQQNDGAWRFGNQCKASVDEAAPMVADNASGNFAPWQERVLAERDALQINVDKLADFVWPNLPSKVGPIESDLLEAQLSAMRTYLAILKMRIMRF